MTNVKLNDVFWTFQGEGFHAGRRALFVRMPFCNLKCTWCDTTFNTHEDWTKEEFLGYALDEPARFAVVTGGEPTMNKHTPVVLAWLKEAGFEVACESNGMFKPQKFDWVTISPKRFSQDKSLPPYWIAEEVEYLADEFKYVVDKEFDFSILDRHANSSQVLSLSPEWGDKEANLEKIFSYITKNPKWRISLQTHKILGVK